MGRAAWEELHDLLADADQKVIDAMIAKINDTEKVYKKRVKDIEEDEAKIFEKEYSKILSQFRKKRF